MKGSRIRHPLVAEPLLGCGHAVTAQAAVDPAPTAVPGKVTSQKANGARNCEPRPVPHDLFVAT